MFGADKKTITSVIGFRPLPGTYGYKGESLDLIADAALYDAKHLVENGIDAFMIQNVNDLPVRERCGHDTVAYMAVLGERIRREFPQAVLGVNVLKNDAPAALSVAHAIGAKFIRLKVYVGAMVGAEGLVQGCAHEVQELRRKLGAWDVAIYADVYDRTGIPLVNMSLEDMAHEAVWFGKADGLVITGRSVAESLDWAARVKKRVKVPVWCGGGATAENIKQLLEVYDGVQVSSSLRTNGWVDSPIDPAAVRRFVEVLHAAGY